MDKKTKTYIEWGLFLLFFLIEIINALWVKEELLDNIGRTFEIAWLLTLCYGFKSSYRWLVIASYIWRILLIAALLFVWCDYILYNGQN